MGVAPDPMTPHSPPERRPHHPHKPGSPSPTPTPADAAAAGMSADELGRALTAHALFFDILVRAWLPSHCSPCHRCDKRNCLQIIASAAPPMRGLKTLLRQNPSCGPARGNATHVFSRISVYHATCAQLASAAYNVESRLGDMKVLACARSSLTGGAVRQLEEDGAVRDEKLKQAQSNLRRGADGHHSMGASSQDGGALPWRLG